MRSTCVARVAALALGLSGGASCGLAAQPATQAHDASAESNAGAQGSGGSTSSGGVPDAGEAAQSGGAPGGGGRAGSGSGGSAGTAGASGSGGASSTGGRGNAGGNTSSGGAGAGGRGGSGGLAVPGGAGGTVSVPLGSCGGAQVTAKLVAAKAPVVLAAMLTSSDPADYAHVSLAPTSATDTVLVALNSSDHIVTVAPGGVSDDSTGVCGSVIGLRVDDGDVPRLFATTQPVPSGQIGTLFYAFWTPAQPTWSAELFSEGAVVAGAYTLYPEGDMGLDAFPGSNGQLRVLTSRTASDTLWLFDRSSPGVWTPTQQIVQYARDSAVALDSLGRTRVVYSIVRDSSGYASYCEWTDGNVLTDFRKNGTDTNLAVAAGLSGILGVARVNDAGIVVTYSDGTTVGSDHIVPGTAPYPQGQDPCYTNSDVCQPVTCTNEGVIPGSIALTSTSDGAFWLAYRIVHIVDEYAAQGINTHYCWTLSKTTTTSKVVLFRLTPDNSVAPSMRWSYASASGSPAAIDLSARGQRLYLGFPDDNVANVFVFDWGAL